jgi:hypothetical protein
VNLHEATDMHFAEPGELEEIQRREFAALRRQNTLRGVMGSGEGRDFVMSLFAETYQSQPIASLDPLQMMQRVAVRDFGLSLRNEIQLTCPDLLTLAERESNDRSS